MNKCVLKWSHVGEGVDLLLRLYLKAFLFWWKLTSTKKETNIPVSRPDVKIFFYSLL